MQITPGYDFGQFEKPSRETLLRMIEGMTITGIGFANLDTAVNVVTVNDSTAASNLPNNGSLWVDSRNNLWGRTKWGDVIVRRAAGGLETNRLLSLGDGAAGPALPGQVLKIAVDVANGTTPSNTRVHGTIGNGYDLSTLEIGVAQETAVSHGTTHFRTVLLGRTRLHSPDFQPSFNAKRGRLYQKAVNSNYWTMEDHDPGNTPAHSAQAEAIERDPDIPGVDAGGSAVHGYFFGLPIRKA